MSDCTLWKVQHAFFLSFRNSLQIGYCFTLRLHSFNKTFFLCNDDEILQRLKVPISMLSFALANFRPRDGR